MKKTYFILTNALLVVIVGTLIGVFCNDILSGVRLSAFVCLLITLCGPTVAYMFKEKNSFSTLIAIVLFLVGELACNIVFIANESLDVKAFAVTQSCLVGTFLVVMLITIASMNNNVEVEA